METNTNLKRRRRRRRKEEENTSGKRSMEGGMIGKEVEGLGRSV